MFETSVVRVQAQRAGSRLSLLTISLLAHSAVVIGVVAASIASVDFPAHAPDELAQAPSFLPVRIPPPLGTPNGGGAKSQPVQPARPAPLQQQAQANEITAPQHIPNDAPSVQTAAASGSTVAEGEATSAGPIGVAYGEEGSLGDLDAPPAPMTHAAPLEEKIYEVHEVKAPVLLHRHTPEYPQRLIKTGLKALVVVRCVIDRNGRVRDPQIIRPDLPPFNAAVIEAVQRWRYTPGSRNGVAVETYLNVTVSFSVD